MRKLSILGLMLAACGGGGEDAAVLDTGSVAADSGEVIIRDTGVPDTGSVAPDAEADAGVPDQGFADTGAPDSGVALMPALVPGQYIQVAEARIAIGDAYSDVIARLGRGQRSDGMGARSYEWTLSSNVELTIWFANSNLDGDDSAPNDVDATDRVLWVAVQGGFTGRTPENVALGSTRANLETAYGAPPHEVPLTNPMGTLAQYFTRGLLVALGTDNTVRTLTLCRAYPLAPNAELDLPGGRLRFRNPNFDLRGALVGGTSGNDVTQRLGPPDAEGTIQINNRDLYTLSYGFIGIEVFCSESNNRCGNVLFVNVHAPYYGTTSGGFGVGTARMAFETFLSGGGYGQGRPSSQSASFLCYEHANNDVGVTYTSGAMPEVSSLTIPLLQCP